MIHTLPGKNLCFLLSVRQPAAADLTSSHEAWVVTHVGVLQKVCLGCGIACFQRARTALLILGCCFFTYFRLACHSSSGSACVCVLAATPTIAIRKLDLTSLAVVLDA
ncbi:hypothetical protein COO60DRAFT_659845 [Scenedesmus sp. NREL 46B-D3]|nr:hypothetical protein COO60DRAFT_659845 [Scenedesmus sp. NREL 46B-D3]